MLLLHRRDGLLMESFPPLPQGVLNVRLQTDVHHHFQLTCIIHNLLEEKQTLEAKPKTRVLVVDDEHVIGV